jgi:hypothetical protein
MGIGFAMCAVSSLIIFPLTASFGFFGVMTRMMAPVGGLLKAHIRILRDVRPSSPEFRGYEEIGANAVKVLGSLVPLEMLASGCSLEVSYGRFDPGDVGEFKSLLKSLINVLASFEFFYHGIQLRKNVLFNELKLHDTAVRMESIVSQNESKQSSRFYAALHKTYKPVGEFENQRRMDMLKISLSEAKEEDLLSIDDLDKLMDQMQHRFGPAMEAADRAIAAMTKWIVCANEFRIYSLLPGRFEKHVAAQQSCCENLVHAQSELRHEMEKLEESRWEDILNAEQEFGALIAALICHGSVYGFATQRLGRILDRMITVCCSLDEERPCPELITPFTKSHRSRTRFNRGMIGQDQDISNPDSLPGFVPYQRTQVRDPEASPPRTVWHLIGKRVLAFYYLLLNKHFLFSLRCAGFVVITAIPVFCRPTALWFYGNRLIWAVVMCAISTEEHPGDLVYGYVCKVVYTFIACVIGMVGWYISTGNGRGNHYGYAAVTLVISFFLSFYRHFSIHINPVPAIILCITTALVIGTSWQDEQHAVITFFVGSGFHVAWVRMVTVVVGISMGLIASVFPRASTGKSAVRKILGRTLLAAGNLHYDVNKFGHQRAQDPLVRIHPRNDVGVLRFRAVFVKLSGVQKLMMMLKYEPSLTGVWPKRKYQLLLRLQRELVQLYYGLYFAFDALHDPAHWAPIMISRYGWASEGLSADLFAVIHMASGSLLSGRALPRITTAQTTCRFISMLQDVWGLSQSAIANRLMMEIDTKRAEEEEEEEETGGDATPYATHSSHRYPFSGMGMEKILTHDGQLTIVGLMLIRMIYERMDEIMLVVKGLVGEEFDADPSQYSDEAHYETAHLLI